MKPKRFQIATSGNPIHTVRKDIELGAAQTVVEFAIGFSTNVCGNGLYHKVERAPSKHRDVLDGHAMADAIGKRGEFPHIYCLAGVRKSTRAG